MNIDISIRKQCGIALPSVLWLTAVCVIVSATYASNVKQSVQAITNIKGAIYLRYMARSGVYIAISEILQESNTYSGNTLSRTINVKVMNYPVKIKITPEMVKHNINTLDEEKLNAVFRKHNIDDTRTQVLSQRIMDWIDRDRKIRQHGMEDEEYYNDGYRYGAKDQPLEDLIELMLVKGMDRKTYKLIQKDLTLYPAGSGRVFSISSEARNNVSGEVGFINAVVHLTNDSSKPYRIIKWNNDGMVL